VHITRAGDVCSGALSVPKGQLPYQEDSKNTHNEQKNRPKDTKLASEHQPKKKNEENHNKKK